MDVVVRKLDVSARGFDVECLGIPSVVGRECCRSKSCVAYLVMKTMAVSIIVSNREIREDVSVAGAGI